MSSSISKEMTIVNNKILRPNEVIKSYTNIIGSFTSDRNVVRYKDGLICATDQRVILVFKKLLGHIEEIFSYEVIENMKIVKNNNFATLSLVYKRGHMLVSSSVNGPENLLRFVENIRNNIININETEFGKVASTYNKKLEELQRDQSIIEKNIEEERYYLNKIKEEYNYYRGIIDSTKESASPILKEYNEKLIMPFSDYEEIPSSHELKTQLSLLKLKEKEIKDVMPLINDDEILNKREHKSQQRQILRNFNVECDYIFSKMTHKNIESSHNKLVKSYEQLNKLFEVDNVKINEEILLNKLDQLSLIAQYNIALEQEKQIRKEERERIAEEQKAEKELNNALTKLQKEENQFKNETEKLTKYMQGTSNDVEKEIYADKIKQLQEQLKALQDDKVNINKRLENTRAGYVYIISNVGSFGENIYKIGVTRRLEPRDRIKELSSASVPFEFDIHAIIFSEDAPKLENTLHKHFKEQEVNRINPRKEFFNVSLEDIKDVVLKEHNDTVRFEMEAEAYQYRESIKLIESLSS